MVVSSFRLNVDFFASHLLPRFHVNWFLYVVAWNTISIASVQNAFKKRSHLNDIRKIVSEWYLKFVIQLNESHKIHFWRTLCLHMPKCIHAIKQINGL